MSLSEIECKQCKVKPKFPNRIITDSCGHKKCRQCLITEPSECHECLNSVSDHTKEQVQLHANQKTNSSSKQTSNDSDNKEKNSKTLRDHIIVKYNENGSLYYSCTVCNRSFRCRSQQYYHMECNRADQKKFKCTECSKTFSTKSHLQYHLQSHTPIVHQCSKCQKTFKNSLVLKKHEKIHVESFVSCSECNKKFRNKDSLKIHRLLHREDEFKHACHICNKKYSTKSNLHQHMLKHCDKKFQCSVCSKRFQRNSTLKSHMKKHNKTENVICLMCNKQFSDAATLQRHSKFHEEEITKYHCTFCDITSVRKDNMLRHVRNIHPEGTFENCVTILKTPDPNQFIEPQEVLFNTKDHHHHHQDQQPPPPPHSLASASEDEAPYKPKTIENSSVIKCIGNVEPVKIPHIENKPKATEMIVTKPAEEKPTVPEYDPIELYRKILSIGDEDDDDDVVDDKDHGDNEQYYTNDSINQVSNVVVVDQPLNNDLESGHHLTTLTCGESYEPTRSYCWNNFSEMHWRKNFMNTYETDGHKGNIL